MAEVVENLEDIVGGQTGILNLPEIAEAALEVTLQIDFVGGVERIRYSALTMTIVVPKVFCCVRVFSSWK